MVPVDVAPLELLAEERVLMRDVHALAFEGLEGPVAAQVSALVLDHLGVAVVGATMPWTRRLLGLLTDCAAPAARPVSTLWGEPVAGLRDAALAGGTAAHGFDLDDTHLATMSHPGCSVIAAALVAAEATGASGDVVLGAIAAGYEVIGRVVGAIGLEYGEKGYHATGQIGPLGAAAAAARCLGGSPAHVEHAIALATSMGGGIKAFTAGGGDVKRLHGGRAAEAGLLAALLACRGMAGPNHPLAGELGLIATSTVGTADLSVLTGHPDGLVVHSTIVKEYPACAALHGAIAAAEQLAPLGDDDIVAVDVGTTNRVLNQNLIARPTDPMAAQYSLEWATAAALLGRGGRIESYLYVDHDDQRPIAALARKVSGHLDERVERRYPHEVGATVRVTFSSGDVREADAFLNTTDGTGPEVAERKFRSIVATLLEPDAIERSIGATYAMGDGVAIGELVVPIRTSPTLRSTIARAATSIPPDTDTLTEIGVP